jgi:hypothetical protein
MCSRARPFSPRAQENMELVNQKPTSRDVRAIRRAVGEWSSYPLVRERIRHNIRSQPQLFSQERFWHATIRCLLTSRQRVGIGSLVWKFMQLRPFPLSLKCCHVAADRRAFIRDELIEFGSLRFYERISRFAASNLYWLERGGWEQVREHYWTLRQLRSRKPKFEDYLSERRSARFIDGILKGFGPKQARNLWQILGLTRYEIPIDSRLRGWINQNLSIHVEAHQLWRPTSYESVLDFLQAACIRAEKILPCVLDAVSFSTGEPKE